MCCSFYTVRLVLNTSFFFKASCLENFTILLFMSSHIKKFFSSLKKHYDLAAKILSYSKIICSCKEYVTYLVICCVESESFKCAKYLLHTFWKYNLVISKTKWACVQRNCLYLYIKIQKTLAYLVHLQKQQNLIKICWEEMIWHEFQNIEKLEADEAYKASKTAIISSLNEFLLNISFN